MDYYCLFCIGKRIYSQRKEGRKRILSGLLAVLCQEFLLEVYFAKNLTMHFVECFIGNLYMCTRNKHLTICFIRLM